MIFFITKKAARFRNAARLSLSMLNVVAFKIEYALINSSMLVSWNRTEVFFETSTIKKEAFHSFLVDFIIFNYLQWSNGRNQVDRMNFATFLWGNWLNPDLIYLVDIFNGTYDHQEWYQINWLAEGALNYWIKTLGRYGSCCNSIRNFEKFW